MPFSAGSQVAPPFISDEKIHRREIARWMNDIAMNINTISASVSAINTTVNTLMTGPAFSAYQSVAQSISSSTFTKISFQTEEFDTAAAFDSTTNYRFQPAVAGYYQVNGAVSMQGTTGNNYVITMSKNGIEFKRGNQIGTNPIGTTQVIVSALIYLNGSTDYVELYCYQASGGIVSTFAENRYTYFQASRVRTP